MSIVEISAKRGKSLDYLYLDGVATIEIEGVNTGFFVLGDNSRLCLLSVEQPAIIRRDLADGVSGKTLTIKYTQTHITSVSQLSYYPNYNAVYGTTLSTKFSELWENGFYWTQFNLGTLLGGTKAQPLIVNSVSILSDVKLYAYRYALQVYGYSALEEGFITAVSTDVWGSLTMTNILSTGTVETQLIRAEDLLITSLVYYKDYLDILNNSNYDFSRHFRGIQWDVYLDGSGKEMAITIVPTMLGETDKDLELVLQTSGVMASGTSINSYSKNNYITETIDAYPVNTTWGNLWENDSSFITFTPSHNSGVGIWYSYNLNNIENGIIGGIIPYDLPADANNILQVGSNGIAPLDNTDSSVVIYHLGYYADDDYDDEQDNSDDITEDSGYNSTGLLTTTYAMTPNRLQQLGSKLWNSGFLDNVLLVNNNPIENIVSVKVMPFNMIGTDTEVILGNVPMGVNGAKLAENKSYKVTIGSIPITGKYGSFLDFEPYTKLSIFLPFIGFKDLDCSLFMGKTLKVEYISDVVTGACRAVLYADNVPVTAFDGVNGIDVPIVASNRAQVEAGYFASFVDVALNPSAQNIAENAVSSAMNQYHTNTSGGVSPSCSAYQTRNVFVVYDRPTYQNLVAFNHTHGRMCNLSKTLGLLTGFTRCNGNIDLSGVPCTDVEREELVSILSTGFFA